MNRDLLSLGEAWSLFADRLFAAALCRKAAEESKIGTRPVNPEQKEFRT